MGSADEGNDQTVKLSDALSAISQTIALMRDSAPEADKHSTTCPYKWWVCECDCRVDWNAYHSQLHKNWDEVGCGERNGV